MEKLTSEHLVPYLDKKLQGIDSYTNRKCNLVGLNLNSHEPLIIQMKPEYPTSKRKLVEFKPILHPLSDLTKEVEINGKKLIPIIELVKMALNSSNGGKIICDKVILNSHYNVSNFIQFDFIAKKSVLKDKEDIVVDEDKEYSDDDYYQYEYVGNFIFTYHFTQLNTHFTLYEKHSNCLPINNQFKIFQTLLKWHFDAFGLIEKNLAIDINTLK